MNTGFYFIVTPLQYNNALEAKNYFQNEIKFNKLIILNQYNPKLSTLLALLNNLINKSEWDSIDFINVPYIQNKYISFIISHFYIKYCLRKFNRQIKKEDFLFIGNAGELWFQWLLSETRSFKRIILDDGLATINNVKYLTDGISKQKKDKSSLIQLRLLHPKIIEPNKLVFFSIFNKLNFAPAMFIQNEQKYFKSKYAKSHYKQISKAIFIGQALSENGAISFESYIYMIDSIREYYERKGVEFIYICHRLDNISRLPQHWNILVLNEAVEIYILSQDLIPATILSFFSTALINLKMLIPQISQIISVRIPNKLIKCNLEEINNAYNYFEKERSKMFSVVDLCAIQGH